MPTLDDYAHLYPADLARLLSDVSNYAVNAASIEADVAAGAPTNADGTIDLVAYAAWLLARRENR